MLTSAQQGWTLGPQRTRVKRRAILASGRHQAHFPVEFAVTHGTASISQTTAEEELWNASILKPTTTTKWQQTLAEQLYTKVPQRSSARKQNFAQTDQNATHAEETVCLLILKSISWIDTVTDPSWRATRLLTEVPDPAFPLQPGPLPSHTHCARLQASTLTQDHLRQLAWPLSPQEHLESHLTEPRPWPWIPNCGSLDWFL